MPNRKQSRDVCLEKIRSVVQSDHYVANRSCRISNWNDGDDNDNSSDNNNLIMICQRPNLTAK